ncbi:MULTISPECIES: hypothetical protein [Methylorubrum]|uniref:Uncharacterized protein n=1 Tax=Methylorubrum extorquens (strain CM4 / NCIMB 13688) TaxID=440085 RepID=B7L0U3_METC4|nr:MULTISPECIES: hypothetical protein [Methylorubrum]ACK83314.1 conserved hypothetical protein [Methylorubrum extorquens CM4]MCY1641899.1 hypothetical protein [Methylorubrum sp. SL192]
MAVSLADLVRGAAAEARRLAAGFPASGRKDDFPWAIIAAFDADVRGHVERDRRIEDERDRVLIASVTLAETSSDAEADEWDRARRQLVRAVDYLEETVLRFGIVNRAAARRGYGAAGDPVSTSPQE